ncbi:WD40 repeat-like protein [Piptocephalis cylindrospora]|uniref:WD40 repeat-like protein n=1 Tax=Piptocephalis cylindrospora TaxID=1907219 RepID=A0A4V1IY77_9FUNG|nr:WD40 repeat-like protein [Piptocephalis cylindrospora]|eukprot:RKP13599.1 WD40 repeat-like protein [Piptocephalis cylindrospora]
MYTSKEQQALMEEMDRRKRARELAVPTDDRQIRARLRDLKEPQCLFAEGPSERRDRLRHLLSLRLSKKEKRAAAAGDASDEDEDMSDHESDEDTDMEEGGSQDQREEEDKEEEFYTVGSEDLLHARREMLSFSMPRAKERIERQKTFASTSLVTIRTARNTAFRQLRSYANLASQLGDDRAVAQCAFSPNGQMIATAGWSGLAKIWTVPMCDPIATLNGHTDRLGGIAWHPQATLGQSAASVNLATGGAEGNISLWSLPGKASEDSNMGGHIHRVCRIAFHPNGRYLGSASFDQTWRLWDVEVQKELLLQEGHAGEVFSVAFQGDGSLVATGGLDKVGRVWDTRSGRSAMVLQGHAGPVYSLDWSPNGHQVASGSGDNTVRIWDIRKLSSVQTIAAHTSVVSDIKYYQGALPTNDIQAPISLGNPGMWLLTGSFDGSIRAWSEGDWRMIKSWTGHDGKVMGVDVNRDGSYLASTGFDRTLKLWAHEDTVV